MAKYKPKQIDHSVNVTQTHPLKEFSVLLIGITVIIISIFFSISFLSDFIVQYIPPEKEISFFQKDLNNLTPEENDLQKRVINLWRPFAGNTTFSFHTKIIKLPVENAFISAGGNIVVTKKLIETVESNAELDFILCHELGHFINRDVIRGTLKSQTFSLIVSLLGIDLGTDILKSGIKSIALKFSRDQELAADKFALDCLYKSKGSIKGFDTFFKRVSKQSLLPDNLFIEYMSTHPNPQNRIQKMKNIIKEKGYKM